MNINTRQYTPSSYSEYNYSEFKKTPLKKQDNSIILPKLVGYPLSNNDNQMESRNEISKPYSKQQSNHSQYSQNSHFSREDLKKDNFTNRVAIQSSSNNTNNNNNSNIQYWSPNDWERNISITKKFINNRRDRLLADKDLLNHMSIKGGQSKPRNDISSLYTYQNLSQNRNLLQNKYYNYQMMEPIHYPLEMPIKGEKIKFPNIDYGQVASEDGVIHQKKQTSQGMKKEDSLALLAFLLEYGDFELGVEDFKDILHPKPRVNKEKKDIKGVYAGVNMNVGGYQEGEIKSVKSIRSEEEN